MRVGREGRPRCVRSDGLSHGSATGPPARRASAWGYATRSAGVRAAGLPGRYPGRLMGVMRWSLVSDIWLSQGRIFDLFLEGPDWHFLPTYRGILSTCLQVATSWRQEVFLGWGVGWGRPHPNPPLGCR